MMYTVQIGDKKYYIEVDNSSAVIQKVEDDFDDLPDFDDAEEVCAAECAVLASLPGNICRVLTSAGHRVKKDDVLFLCETMKMELEVLAPCDGTVVHIAVGEGQHVEKDRILAKIDPKLP